MRTPSWETSPGALAALLNSGAPLEKADVYRFTLKNGTVYTWTGARRALQLGSTIYALGPAIMRTQISWQVGVAVDVMTITLIDANVGKTGAGSTFGGVPLAAFIHAGGFNGAEVRVDKVFWGEGSSGPVGALHWFTGFVDDADGSGHDAQLKISSWTKLLDVTVPGPLYGTQCANTLFDGICGLAESAYTVAGAATSSTNGFKNSFAHALGQAAGHFSLGRIVMTSGLNAGVARTVKDHTSTQIAVLQPWPFAVASGDTFTVSPGCDNQPGTCTTKFNNRPRYRGQPLIPVPETAL